MSDGAFWKVNHVYFLKSFFPKLGVLFFLEVIASKVPFSSIHILWEVNEWVNRILS